MQKKINSVIVFLWLLSLSGCGSETFHGDHSDGWIPLLKDDTLDGWYTYLRGREGNQDPDGIFTICDGVLHIYKNAEDGSKAPFGYIATEKEYENYRLRLQFKWGTKKFKPRATDPRDSGILYHFVGKDRVWPLSTECQIMEGDTGSIITVGTTVTSTIDPATGAYKEADKGGVYHTQGGSDVTRITMERDWEVSGWNTVEIIVRNDSAVHVVNGQVNGRCWDILQPDPSNPDRLIPLSRGKILLQAEGAEIYYRQVEIRPLEP